MKRITKLVEKNVDRIVNGFLKPDACQQYQPNPYFPGNPQGYNPYGPNYGYPPNNYPPPPANPQQPCHQQAYPPEYHQQAYQPANPQPPPNHQQSYQPANPQPPLNHQQSYQPANPQPPTHPEPYPPANPQPPSHPEPYPPANPQPPSRPEAYPSAPPNPYGSSATEYVPGGWGAPGPPTAPNPSSGVAPYNGSAGNPYPPGSQPSDLRPSTSTPEMASVSLYPSAPFATVQSLQMNPYPPPDAAPSNIPPSAPLKTSNSYEPSSSTPQHAQPSAEEASGALGASKSYHTASSTPHEFKGSAPHAAEALSSSGSKSSIQDFGEALSSSKSSPPGQPKLPTAYASSVLSSSSKSSKVKSSLSDDSKSSKLGPSINLFDIKPSAGTDLKPGVKLTDPDDSSDDDEWQQKNYREGMVENEEVGLELNQPALYIPPDENGSSLQRILDMSSVMSKQWSVPVEQAADVKDNGAYENLIHTSSTSEDAKSSSIQKMSQFSEHKLEGSHSNVALPKLEIHLSGMKGKASRG